MLSLSVWAAQGSQAMSHESVHAADSEIDLLVISSYSSYYRWSSNITEHIAQTSARNYGKKVSTVSLSLMRVNTKQDMDSLTVSLRRTLEECHPKNIVVVGSSSFAFCDDINDWYPDIPMVLIGGQTMAGTKEQVLRKEAITEENSITTSDLRAKYNITVQNTPVFLKEELAMIVDMMPELKTIYYINGEDQFSKSKELIFRQHLSEFSDSIELRTLNSGEMNTEELLEITKSLDPRTNAIIYASWLNVNMAKNSPFLMNQVVYLLDQSSAPLFVLRDNGMMEEHSDIVGGCFLDETDYYRSLDHCLEQLFAGTPARDIPDYVAPSPVKMFNYGALKRYGIDESNWPEDAIIMDKPLPFYKEYSDAIYIVLFVILFYLILFLAMIALKNRKMNQMSQYYKNLVDNLPIHYVKLKLVRDDDGLVFDLKGLFANQAFKRVSQSLGGLFIGVGAHTVLPKSADDFISNVNNAAKKDLPYTRFMFNLVELGQYYEMVVLFNDDDTIDVFAINMTEQKLAEEALKIAKEKAENSDKQKTRFVQNMSHEIRTPLNAIVGFAQLLSLPDGYNTEEEKNQYSSFIQSNSNMLMMLIDDILDLGDVENGNYKVELGDAPCNEMCRQAIKSVEYRTPEGVRMYFTTEVDDSFVVYTDPRRVQQVLINYLTNACKHTAEGEIQVHLSKSEEPGKLVFSVRDTGTGVPPEQAENIFERFSKLDAFKQGAGLGLNICRTIADKLGGSVRLDTSYTDGARFLFVLPLIEKTTV